MVSVGGRIKAAGLSLQFLYDLSEPLILYPSVTSAEGVTEVFNRLRNNPPYPIRASFFPRDRGNVRSLMKSSPAFLRPFLKTDQGPAGNFLGMRIDKDDSFMPVQITRSKGMAVPELFFIDQIKQNGIKGGIDGAIQEIQQGFESDEHETILALERLRMICEEQGIAITREVDVGRDPFFFIRPVQGEDLVNIPQRLAAEIEQDVLSRVGRIETKAFEVERMVMAGASLSEAVEQARNLESNNLVSCTATHYQADVLVRKDGSFVVDSVHFPDVALFLTQIYSKNDVFLPIQDIVREIVPTITKAILSKLKRIGVDNVFFITRDEVVSNYEDMLELLEIQALREILKERGIESQVIKATQVDSLPVGSAVLPLNLNISQASYETLLKRVAKGEVFSTTNPFIRLFEAEATGLRSFELREPDVTNFTEVFSQIEMDGRGALMQFLALEQMLSRAGIGNEDIFYFSIPVSSGRIPAFRYDLRSFQMVVKMIERLQRNGTEVDSLFITPVPFHPDDALIIGKDGPRLAVCRFMFVGKE